MSEASTKPYLIRAIYEWCTDNGFTPYIAVAVDANTRVPMEFVKNNEIVLNISFTATSKLKIGNEFVEFYARFSGVSREIVIPIENVAAIYARENGQGMAFPVTAQAAEKATQHITTGELASLKLTTLEEEETDDDPKPTRPQLKRVK